MTHKQSDDVRLLGASERRAGAAPSGILNREMQRGRPALVLQAYIGSVDQKRTGSGGATCAHSAVERCDTAFIPGVRIRTRLDQEVNDVLLGIGIPTG